MQKELLLVVIVLGIIVALIGIGLFFYNPKEKKKQGAKPLSLADIKEIVQQKDRSEEELEKYADKLLNFSFTDTSKKDMIDIAFLLTAHKNSNKNIIIKVDKGLKGKNSEFSKDVDVAIKAGLDSRR